MQQLLVLVMAVLESLVQLAEQLQPTLAVEAVRLIREVQAAQVV
jgi:hypothetical protein